MPLPITYYQHALLFGGISIIVLESSTQNCMKLHAIYRRWDKLFDFIILSQLFANSLKKQKLIPVHTKKSSR